MALGNTDEEIEGDWRWIEGNLLPKLGELKVYRDQVQEHLVLVLHNI